MLKTRWIKVISDLWSHRVRTLIVALAVAVGVYAVGSVLAVQALMLREFHADRDDAAIASAIIIAYPPFDAKLAERIAEMPGVAAAEGRQSFNARVITDADTNRDIEIAAVEDFDAMQVDKYLLVDGTWPTRKDEIMLEWMGLPWIGAEIGDTITVELPDDTRRHLTITGTAHNPQHPSPGVTGNTSGLVSPKTMEYLGQSPLFSELHLRVVGADPDKTTVQSVVDDVEKQIERSDRAILDTVILGESIIESIVNTTILILSTFSWVILLLSAFLVVNTITALIAQQVNQIGIMKLIGASRGQMVSMYMAMVLVYGVLAFTIGIPIAVTVARLLMTNLIEDLVNIRTDSYAIPAWVYLVMIGVGVLIPLGAGLLPVWQGTRITTYAALNDVGIHAGAASGGVVEHLLARLPKRWLQRPFVLALRNALRHKGRLLRTMVVLILGTALFIAVISTQQSVYTTQAGFLLYHQYDVRIQFEQPHRIARLEAAAFDLPDVTAVESWGIGSATRLRPDDSESNRYQVYGLPEKTQMVKPIVHSGRWLRPGDEYAVVINATVADEERDIEVGDTITLDMAGHELPWTVVGIVGMDAQGAKLYMNYDVFGHETRMLGKANSLQVVTGQHDQVSQADMETALLRHFEQKGMDVRGTKTTQTLNSQNGLMFDTIIGFLILMAVLLGAVGSLGLSTTMGINMMERIREIGVLRAIGASNGAIRRIVLLEGLVIASLSWLIGFVLSFPAAKFMSSQIGVALLDMPLTYTYSYGAAAAWFFVLLGLAVVASLGPAASAVKLTIREVLAYE
jgi:putative ABC transport system permease protein